MISIQNAAQGLVLVEFDSVDNVRRLLALTSAELAPIGVLYASAVIGSDSSLTTASPSSPNGGGGGSGNPADANGEGSGDSWKVIVGVICGVIAVAVIVGVYFYRKSGPSSNSQAGRNATFHDYMQRYGFEVIEMQSSEEESSDQIAARSKDIVRRNALTVVVTGE